MTGRARSTLLALLLVWALASGCTDHPAAISTAPGVRVPDPPTGTRWQGMNGVVVAVPRSWATSTESCQPAADTVWMTSTEKSPVPCPLVRAQGSFLQVGGVDPSTLRHRAKVGGLELRHGGVRCRTSASGPCTLEFAVPSRDASFQIFYLGPSPTEFVTRMMRSVMLL